MVTTLSIIIVVLLVWILILKAAVRQLRATIDCYLKKWMMWEKAYWKCAPAVVKLARDIKNRQAEKVKEIQRTKLRNAKRYARNFPL